MFQRAAGAHNLFKYAADALFRHSAFALRPNFAQHFGLPVGTINGRISASLNRTDLLYNFSSSIQKLNDLSVDFIDLSAKGF